MRRLWSISIIFFLAFLLSVCKNTDSVSPTQRSTFIRLFEKAGNYEAQVAEVASDGYLIGFNLENSASVVIASVVVKTDFDGKVIWEHQIDSSSIVSIKPAGTDLLILGDLIHLNGKAVNINDRIVTKALITRLDASSGTPKGSASFSNPKEPLTDFHATGLAIDLDGNIITSGNKMASATNPFNQAYLAVYQPSFDTVWTRFYGLLDQDLTNARNVYRASSTQILWGSFVTGSQSSYLNVSITADQSAYDNSDLLGQNLTQNKLSSSEVQPGFQGYGMVGTITDGHNQNGNMFFLRIIGNGVFEKSSIVFFDGLNGQVPTPSLDGQIPTGTEDQGTAITSTLEGGFIIGGTMTTAVGRGNGGKDIWLIKVDVTGTPVWNKVYGGTGDETVKSIRSLNDGSFLVAGGSNTNGLIAGYLMRIDANGELKK